MKVFVVGDVMLDIEMHVRPRGNLEGATTCLTGTRLTYYPGGAANVAAILRGQGQDVSLFGMVGPDWAAEELCNLLGGIDLHLSPLLTVTTTKSRFYSSEMLTRIDCERPRPSDWAVKECLREFYRDPPDCVVFSDYGKGVFSSQVRSAVQEIIHHNPTVPTVVDPKPCGNDDVYTDIWNGCTVAVPNNEEANGMNINPQNLIVTHSDKGAIITGSFGVMAVPCDKVENPQVVGAGDAFTAGVAISLAKGMDVIDSAQFAVEFATDYVTRPRAKAYNGGVVDTILSTA